MKHLLAALALGLLLTTAAHATSSDATDDAVGCSATTTNSCTCYGSWQCGKSEDGSRVACFDDATTGTYCYDDPAPSTGCSCISPKAEVEELVGVRQRER